MQTDAAMLIILTTPDSIHMTRLISMAVSMIVLIILLSMVRMSSTYIVPKVG